MEREARYLTYNDYQSLGGTLDQVSFNLLEFEAEREIDLRTQNRLTEIEISEIPFEVNYCTFMLINLLNLYKSDINKNISSESVGSYSVNYGENNKERTKAKNAEVSNLIRTMLAGVIINNQHILFAGVDNIGC